LLDSEDPWVGALARWQLGKMRIMIGQGGPEAEAYLEMALAEFRTLGERFGISLALSELADFIAMRGEFASACAHYEQAIAVITEVGAIEDVIGLRTRQALLYWLHGDHATSAVAIAEAERCAGSPRRRERVRRRAGLSWSRARSPHDGQRAAR
jgi:hypothetical protein